MNTFVCYFSKTKSNYNVQVKVVYVNIVVKVKTMETNVSPLKLFVCDKDEQTLAVNATFYIYAWICVNMLLTLPLCDRGQGSLNV